MAAGRNLADWEDLIAQILVKLPVESLQRCKCVCKSWFHLIENPNFIYRHLDYHKNNGTILILENRDYSPNKRMRVISLEPYESISLISPYLMMPSFSCDSSFAICGPCNGLICISNYRDSWVLCNPSLRESKLLPPHPFQITSKETCFVNFIGLGFDTSTNDYKFITQCSVWLFTGEESSLESEVLVYSVSTDSWRKIDTDCKFRLMGYSYVGTLFNGSLHWTEMSGAGQKILCFDMKTEGFSFMKLPCIDRNSNICLKVLDESLALLVHKLPCDDSAAHYIDLWVMHKYVVEESWTKQVTVEPMTGFVAPLFFWKNEALIVESGERRLAAISLDTGEMKDLDERPNIVTVYQESLISIK